MNDMEQLIKSSVSFTGVATTGFHNVRCPVCNDHKIRAGFKFEPNMIIYNCFRGKCEANAIYEINEPITKKFQDVLEAFHIEVTLEIKGNNLKKVYNEVFDEDLYEKHSYKSVELPKNYDRYDPEKHVRFRNYLDGRCIHDDDYYVGVEGMDKHNLLIPFRFYNKIIGYQIVNIRANKYYKSSGNSDLLYLPDGKVPDNPILVEGIFDAKSIPNGVACLQNKISKKQAYILRKIEPLLLSDRTGGDFMDNAKMYEWKITCPKWAVKDVNEALQKYGKLVVCKKIGDGIVRNTSVSNLKDKLWRVSK